MVKSLIESKEKRPACECGAFTPSGVFAINNLNLEKKIMRDPGINCAEYFLNSLQQE